VGRCGAVAFDGGGAGTVVTDDVALALHHRERDRKVRWGPKRPGRGATSGSPSRRMRATSRGKSGRGVTDLVSEAGGPILGRMGEAAACMSTGEKEWGGKGK
jgi:hypothetical protein